MRKFFLQFSLLPVSILRIAHCRYAVTVRMCYLGRKAHVRIIIYEVAMLGIYNPLGEILNGKNGI